MGQSLPETNGFRSLELISSPNPLECFRNLGDGGHFDLDGGQGIVPATDSKDGEILVYPFLILFVLNEAFNLISGHAGISNDSEAVCHFVKFKDFQSIPIGIRFRDLLQGVKIDVLHDFLLSKEQTRNIFVLLHQ